MKTSHLELSASKPHVVWLWVSVWVSVWVPGHCKKSLLRCGLSHGLSVTSFIVQLNSRVSIEREQNESVQLVAPVYRRCGLEAFLRAMRICEYQDYVRAPGIIDNTQMNQLSGYPSCSALCLLCMCLCVCTCSHSSLYVFQKGYYTYVLVNMVCEEVACKYVGM